MRHAISWGSAALVVAAAVACDNAGTSGGPTDEQPDGGATVDAGVPPAPEDAAPPEQPAGTGGNTGLPCDIQVITENRCIACHGGSLAGVPTLLTYSDFMKRSTVDPTKNLAQMSLVRMKSTTSPMPPAPAAPPEPDEIQTFEEWVNAGTPRGAACTTPPPPDGGTTGDAGRVDAGGSAGDGGCTSGTLWTGGNMKSPLMNPGEACLACHQVMGGPNLRVAGTVFPTLHEPNDCYGSPPPLTVVVTDANNKVIQMPVNAAGNFDTRTRYAAPYKAIITDGTKTRAMMGTVTSGDCNSCHTQNGTNGAPGRILAP
jgi:mono/diheme cytochrome c family protein